MDLGRDRTDFIVKTLQLLYTFGDSLDRIIDDLSFLHCTVYSIVRAVFCIE